MVSVLEAICYTHDPNPTLQILDQLQLPHETKYLTITSAADGWKAIKSMSTRGAPAIAIVAALSLAVELANTPNLQSETAEDAQNLVKDRLKYLVTSRPTAVNLEDAACKLTSLVDLEAAKPGSTARSVIKAYTTAAEAMLIKDVEDNEAIGKNGAEWITKNVESSSHRKLNVITHCNTG
jgi:methylthioribose-1-phosphate isomerase